MPRKLGHRKTKGSCAERTTGGFFLMKVDEWSLSGGRFQKEQVESSQSSGKG